MCEVHNTTFIADTPEQKKQALNVTFVDQLNQTPSAKSSVQPSAQSSGQKPSESFLKLIEQVEITEPEQIPNKKRKRAQVPELDFNMDLRKRVKPNYAKLDKVGVASPPSQKA